MKLSILLIASISVSVRADCATTGCGTRICTNDKSVSCTNCGCSPCVDVYGYCWSCAGTDNRCYPYDCKTYCSTVPCGSHAIDAILINKAVEITAPFLPPFKRDQHAVLVRTPTNEYCSPVLKTGNLTFTGSFIHVALNQQSCKTTYTLDATNGLISPESIQCLELFGGGNIPGVIVYDAIRDTIDVTLVDNVITFTPCMHQTSMQPTIL